MIVSVLTPAGTGAIATVRLGGSGAWSAVRDRFRPAGSQPLPEVPERHRVWFGTLGEGGDEVVLGVESVEPDPVIDIHCHGGRQVVKWVIGLFPEAEYQPASIPPLARAPTLRTASILLDQQQGAFDRAVEECLSDLSRLPRLAALAPLGRHLIEPWRVVLAGPPNVGKSSLINALAGYERSVVAPVAGTTRDIVTVRVAFEGWPVELSDTAGLRDTEEELESAGIARTKSRLELADLAVWVMDATEPVLPPENFPGICVANKLDLLPDAGKHWDFRNLALAVSAKTGEGIPLLIFELVRRLVPISPKPGEGVPFTPVLSQCIEQAEAAYRAGKIDEARAVLQNCHGERFASQGS